MPKRKLLLGCVVVLLYAGTWVGGWNSHARQLEDHADAAYRMDQGENRAMEAQAREDDLRLVLPGLVAGTAGLLASPSGQGPLLTASALTPERTMKFHPIELRQGGPTSGVRWCVPVLPGVLLADSYYCVGPLCAAGGVKIVLYDGLGPVEVPTPWYWVT